MSLPYYQGTGRRKTSIARVRLVPGEGQIVINGRTYVEHFGGAIPQRKSSPRIVSPEPRDASTPW